MFKSILLGISAAIALFIVLTALRVGVALAIAHLSFVWLTVVIITLVGLTGAIGGYFYWRIK